jgi:hypothetical protein
MLFGLVCLNIFGTDYYYCETCIKQSPLEKKIKINCLAKDTACSVIIWVTLLLILRMTACLRQVVYYFCLYLETQKYVSFNFYSKLYLRIIQK